MSNTVKLAGALPGDAETNSLDALVEELVQDAHNDNGPRLAVVWLDVKEVRFDPDEQRDVPTVRLRRIEDLGPVQTAPQAVVDVALEAGEKRLGRTPLPKGVVDVEKPERVDDDNVQQIR